MSVISIQRFDRWGFVGLVALGLLLGMAFQGSRGLWSPDEGRYVDGALQMLDSGDYLVPAYSPSEVNLSKPPATYWIIAASMKVFGRNTWAARVPYALFYLATILLLYAMGRLLIPEKPWLPGLVYGCSAFPFIAANLVTTDALLTLCEAVAMYGFLSFAFGSHEHSRRSLLLMWAGWGAAFLAKGPPGLLPLLAIVPFMVIRDGWRSLARLFPPAGILLFLLIGLGWYAVVVIRIPWALHYFLHGEVYNRIFTAAQHRNAGPIKWAAVYLPTIVLGTAPWWRSLARTAGALLARTKSKGAADSAGSIQRLLALWFFIPFVIFCLAQSRLPLYLLPLFLPLSLAFSLELRDRIDLRGFGQRAWLGAWIFALLAVKAGVAYGVHPATDNRLLARRLLSVTDPGGYSAVVFIEDTALDYDIEENTPWGIRLYLDKPVYGVAWHSPQAGVALCKALRHSGSALLVIDRGLAPGIASTPDCASAGVIDLGEWEQHSLKRVRIGRST
ncbi:MAG: glycosyltransferase family 39 protein [Proteobacteria bacterium]|nr:glycosyltransferase family 39 protein [Pseudomonadota bacterium]